MAWAIHIPLQEEGMFFIARGNKWGKGVIHMAIYL